MSKPGRTKLDILGVLKIHEGSYITVRMITEELALFYPKIQCRTVHHHLGTLIREGSVQRSSCRLRINATTNAWGFKMAAPDTRKLLLIYRNPNPNPLPVGMSTPHRILYAPCARIAASLIYPGVSRYEMPDPNKPDSDYISHGWKVVSV